MTAMLGFAGDVELVSMTEARNYLDPNALSRLGSMELVARLVVEGFITGLHKSPYQGFSVEFAEHRQYMPGDEIRYIDWKVFAKSDRYYVKKFEEETNLRSYILLDASGSMGYRSNGLSKLEYGSYLAASLSYLMLKQRDSVGLVTFDTEIKEYIPPRGEAPHLKAILSTLGSLKPGNETQISRIFHELAKRIVRRGLIIVISDLIDQPQSTLSALKHFRHSKHEVIVFHLMDPAEMDFPFEGPVIFRDMETAETLPTQADALRDAYRDELESFLQAYRRGCGANAIDYVLMPTSEPYAMALASYLSHRQR